MTKIANLLVTTAFAAGLGACVATPVYAPQASGSTSGYSEQRLDQTHYKVSFTGRRSTSRDTVEAGLLLRAAEVTTAAGFSHFIIDTRQTAQEIRPSIGPAFGPWGGGWGPGWGYGWGDPFYHSRFGGRWGLGDPYWYGYSTFDDDTRFIATADITLVNGARDPHAIEARDVVRNLGPQLVPPPAAAAR